MANAALERQVAKRTAALKRRATPNVRRGGTEREEHKPRLRRAQADLVQAGKAVCAGRLSRASVTN